MSHEMRYCGVLLDVQRSARYFAGASLGGRRLFFAGRNMGSFIVMNILPITSFGGKMKKTTLLNRLLLKKKEKEKNNRKRGKT